MTIDLPPQDLNAEQAVLGCCMLGGKAVMAVRDIITDEDFYSDVNAEIFRAVLDVYDRDEGDVDALLVASRLEANGTLGTVGGPVYVRECLETVHYDAHAAHYAEIVASKSRRRKAIVIGMELISGAKDSSIDDVEVVEAAHDAAMKMGELLRVKNTRPRPLRDFVFQTIDTYRQGTPPSVFWGIPDIDQLIDGVMLGELVCIGARPSCGKSLIGLQWLDCAAKKGITSLIISEEMSGASLGARNLTAITELDPNDWFQSADHVEADAKAYFANRAEILVAEKCSTIGSVERTIARAVQSHGVKMVAVDYAQLIEGVGPTRAAQVGNVSTRLKNAAMRHEIIIILLAQLNRGVIGRQDAIPQLSDFKDSGSLEQDADVVLMLHWPSKHDDFFKDLTEYRIYCRKNRNRGIGDPLVTMKIRPERQRVESIAEHYHDIAERSF